MAERKRADSERRLTIDVAGAVGGWPYPWPNVAELARVLPADSWTLIGGLMTQMHAIHHGVDAVRPTNDVDIVLHIETARGIPEATAVALESQKCVGTVYLRPSRRWCWGLRTRCQPCRG